MRRHAGWLLILWLLLPRGSGAEEITPSHVYAQGLRIQQESTLIQRHLGIPGDPAVEPVRAALLPRHVWQKSYLIMLKIQLFRAKRGLPMLSIGNLAPVADLSPALNLEQTRRILAEIAILKEHMGLAAASEPPPLVMGKTPTDVFNLLNAISRQWDALNGQEVTPAHVYAQVRRVSEDVGAILAALRLPDAAFPPARVTGTTPADSLEAAFTLMAEVQRLQHLAAIPWVDFTPFRKKEGVTPSDVLNMVALALAELQTVKAHLGMGQRMTPPLAHQEEVDPADVRMFIGYVVNQLRQIRGL